MDHQESIEKALHGTEREIFVKSIKLLYKLSAATLSALYYWKMALFRRFKNPKKTKICSIDHICYIESLQSKAESPISSFAKGSEKVRCNTRGIYTSRHCVLPPRRNKLWVERYGNIGWTILVRFLVSWRRHDRGCQKNHFEPNLMICTELRVRALRLWFVTNARKGIENVLLSPICR